MANILGIGKNNSLIGTAGDDRIDGYGEDDFINGGAGNDTIVYYDSDNPANIDGGKGVNALDAAKSSSAVNVILSNYKNISNYIGSNFNDTITGTAGANLIRTGSGNNYIDGMGGNDNIIGGAGNDTIVYYANASIDGGAGRNILTAATAKAGVNIDLSKAQYKNIQEVIGSSYADNIVGGAVGGMLEGGAGNDILAGGKGQDIYFFEAGFGNDTIMNATGSSSDTILFGKGIAKSDLIITRNGLDLVLNLNSEDSSLTLKNWYNTSSNKVNTFKFEDGSTESIDNYDWSSNHVAMTGKFDIVFDYSYDSNHFFDNALTKQVLEEAASAWENVINEKFILDSPKTHAKDADVTIFVEAEKFDNSHTLAIAMDGAADSTKHGQPLVGSIDFNLSRQWFFDATPETADDVPVNQLDLLSIAEHEIGHILGLGNSTEWNKLIYNNKFIGSHAETVYGGPVPLTNTGAGAIPDHWGKDILVGGKHPLLNPYSSAGRREYITALDKAGLADLGYNVV